MKIKTNVHGGDGGNCCQPCNYPPGCNRPGLELE